MSESNSTGSELTCESDEGNVGLQQAGTGGEGAPVEGDGLGEEPCWAQPAFESLLGESIILTETEVFAPGWPTPLPRLPRRLADKIPTWAKEIWSPPAAQTTAKRPVGPENMALWEEMQGLFEQGAELEAHVTGCNKGGLLVTARHLQGFIPASQLVCFPRHLENSAREAYLAQQKGTNLIVRVIELDPGRNRLVLSERACAIRKEGPALLETLRSGDVVEGLISNLCDFGAFVDLGGIDGLIHVSEVSWHRIRHPEDVLRIGERVKVYVLSVDREQQRIALSLKRLNSDPWESMSQRYEVGQVVRGTITNIVDFGAFARIEEGVEGLIHVSELSEEPVTDPHSLVSEGQELALRILRIDGPNHRLGLSLKLASNGEGLESVT